MNWIEQRLFELKDTESQYRTFNARVVATADPATMLGVRVPKLRRLAKEILRSDSRDAFLEELPHTYYEEYLLHAFVLNRGRMQSARLQSSAVFCPSSTTGRYRMPSCQSRSGSSRQCASRS